MTSHDPLPNSAKRYAYTGTDYSMDEQADGSFMFVDDVIVLIEQARNETKAIYMDALDRHGKVMYEKGREDAAKNIEELPELGGGLSPFIRRDKAVKAILGSQTGPVRDYHWAECAIHDADAIEEDCTCDADMGGEDDA